MHHSWITTSTLETIKLGMKEITLPGHMTSLNQDRIDLLMKDPDVKTRIMSCGVNPEDKCLYLITGDASVKVVRPNGRLIPSFAYPAPEGRGVHVSFISRETDVLILSQFLIDAAEDCLTNSSLYISDTYLCDLEVSQVT